MSFLFGFLGVIVGLVVVVLIIAIIVMKSIYKVSGFVALKDLFDVLKNHKSLAYDEYTREKDIGGLTKILEPKILEDFSDFNKELLYSTAEKNLRKIFDAIENKSMTEIKKDDDFVFMQNNIEECINDLKMRNVNVSYGDITFHSHAIKDYEKKNGMATITTSSTVGYYYKNDDKKNVYPDLKRETKYTCKFVYVYDETKLKRNDVAITVNCPNCGAPLRNFGAGNCEYCSSHVEAINLKAWKMISYSEDYK